MYLTSAPHLVLYGHMGKILSAALGEDSMEEEDSKCHETLLEKGLRKPSNFR